MSMTFKGCTKDNNKFLKSYNANKSNLSIIYVDTYGSYGQSRMQPLTIGYFLEVDLEYSDKMKKCCPNINYKS